MNGFVFAIGLLAVFTFMATVSQFRDGEDGSGLFCFLLTIGLAFAAYASWQTPELKAAIAAEEQKRHAEEVTPRRVSSVDGCTVYTFKPSDRWLYFTKCDNAETTTNNEYTVRSGKTSRTETMEIKTK